MDALTLEHDQLQQDVTDETHLHHHSLLARVDQWESRSIERIRQVANEVRLQLRKSADDDKREIRGSLHQISQELKEQRHRESYTEIELNNWMHQLTELRTRLEKPPTIEMMHDEDEGSSAHIPLIQLRSSQWMQGKDSLIVTHSTLLLKLSRKPRT